MAQHAMILAAKIQPVREASGVFKLPLPDVGFDIVLEQHRRPEIRQVQSRKQKIAHYAVEFFGSDQRFDLSPHSLRPVAAYRQRQGRE